MNSTAVRIGIVVILLLGLAGGAFIVLSSSDTSFDSSSSKSDSSSETEEPKSSDKTDLTIKTDMAKIMAEATTYAANNNGLYPDLPSVLYTNGYLEDDFVSPITDEQYVFVDDVPDFGEVQFATSSACNEDQNKFVSARSKRNVAIMTKLSDGSFYCQDNS